MPMFELKNILLSEEGLRETTRRLQLHPHFKHSLIMERHAAFASVLSSFNCSYEMLDYEPLADVITSQKEVAYSNVTVKDDMDFVVEAIDLFVFHCDDFIAVYLKGLNGSNTTPFEGYTFHQLENGTYFLSEILYFEEKLYNKEALSTFGSRVWSCAEEGNVMINDKPRRPKFVGIQGESKQLRGPVKVYIDSASKEDEYTWSSN